MARLAALALLLLEAFCVADVLRRTDDGLGIQWRGKGNREVVRVEAYGVDGIRVRITNGRRPIADDVAGAVLQKPETSPHWTAAVRVTLSGDSRTGNITNGKTSCVIGRSGQFAAQDRAVLEFVQTDTGRILTREYYPLHGDPARALRQHSRGSGSLVRARVSFELAEDERVYGLGQHQHGLLNQRGLVIDLDDYNTEVPVPFLLSSRNYGLLWNVPSRGQVELGLNNRTRFVATATRQVDYLIIGGDSPFEVLERLAEATGHAPNFPHYASGFWQCKMRYATQEELLNVSREFKRRGLPLSVLVVDYHHQVHEGDWSFDPKAWPKVPEMMQELTSDGVEVMVSVWPTVEPASASFDAMNDLGLLAATETGGCDAGRQSGAGVAEYDAFNPDARRYLWTQLQQNYYQHGIRIFWLDADEGGGSVGEDLPWPRTDEAFADGSVEEIGLMYPWRHQQGIFEGLRKAGEAEVLTLSRSAWLGSQRWGGAVWSGDTTSTWESMRIQLAAGLNMQMSGIVWWTMDIGGFMQGNIDDPGFPELIVRWFQLGLFLPIMRNHGARSCTRPHPGFLTCPNEPWSFGEEAYRAINKTIFAREALRPYIARQMRLASAHGRPLMRPLFFDFPQDVAAADITDQFLFGDDYLVAPVMHPGRTTRRVYLPGGSMWYDFWDETKAPVAGGVWLEHAAAPLDVIPTFRRGGAAAETSPLANLV
eukprot:TRINITY_DN30518_c0_g1_i2.p1 TRINITY_DN30518_c0_g1~~TRINITY_DN30518_c0_g1_i2.p1  ORF type:complete len:708 (+),score=148.97 TRINITY_DN30518_c0_g1_i2:61-2184(+)